MTGVVLDGIDTNIKTSFNQKVGTIIGNKLLHGHNHRLMYKEESKGTDLAFQDFGQTLRFPNAAYGQTTTVSSGNAQNISPT